MARTARVSAALVSLLKEGEHHAWTLEDLHAALTRRGIASDFSSVFRAAGKLAAAGVARRFVIEDGRARFELVGDHHDHLFCTRCRELVPIPCPVGRDGFRAFERATGATIAEHHLVLSGVCGKCRRTRAKRGRVA